MIKTDIIAVTRIILRVDDLEIAIGSHRQAETFDPLRNDGRPTYKNGTPDGFFQYDLGGTQHTLILAVGKCNTLSLSLRTLDHWLHDQS
ncbi:hypothetical protein D9M70_646610 [compost metagenome]